jgi:hypothetical protein
VLIYVTGGGAFGIYTSSATIAGGEGYRFSSPWWLDRRRWHRGGYLGYYRWTARAEYLFVQFIEKQREVAPIAIAEQLSSSIARIALNYKFGGNSIGSGF